MAEESNPILITGCSSGIGRATATRLGRAGKLVFATARKLDSIADLERAGCRLLPLDVTDEASMATAVAEVERDHGAVWALVNNAGYGEYGPVEEVSMNRVRRQFETNVFGLARMCQLVLPGMRAAGRGRIVNVGSMGGRLTFPASGYYHASKYAVEAISDALRYEVRPFGVAVSLIEPGTVRTGFEETAGRTLREAAPPDGPYADLVTAMGDTMARTFRRRLSGVSPEKVAAVIEQALAARTPRTRYLVGATARGLVTAHGVLPDRLWDSTLRRGIHPD
ncbi:MAG TPA: oxidoreductase [Mycobacteriales bacterium]|nr:oxidoreductase [Mycobacteriales bacterium]